jgi:hypothetical protein
MITIAIVDDAFESNIKSPEQLFKIRVKRPRRSLRLKWKKSILKTPIFRQAVPSLSEVRTSDTRALHYHTYLYYLQQLGFAVGFPQILAPYDIRRGAGEAVDGMYLVIHPPTHSC